MKEYDLAINHYNTAIEHDYSNNEYYIKRAFIKYYIDDIQGAINDMTAAISHNNKSDFLYSQRAFYKFQKKMYESSIEDYTKAININPKKGHYYYMRGTSENLIGKNTQAQSDFDIYQKSLQN